MAEDNWQKGDLALCVNDGALPWNTPEQLASLSRLKRGRIYTVRGIGNSGPRSGPTLLIKDVPALWEASDGLGWTASRFRKINPLTEQERETALRELNAPARENV